VSRRGRIWFLAACLAVFAAAALWVRWLAPPPGLSGKTPSTVTLAPGATQPAGLTVRDLHAVAELQRQFNADQGHPRLVLALAPT